MDGWSFFFSFYLLKVGVLSRALAFDNTVTDSLLWLTLSRAVLTTNYRTLLFRCLLGEHCCGTQKPVVEDAWSGRH